MTTNIASIITSFNPPTDFYENVIAISQQSKVVILVDNHSHTSYRSIFDLLKNEINIILIENPENRGLATALNQGVQEALKHSPSWIATFDHDTRIPKKYFDRLLLAVSDDACSNRIQMVGPNFLCAEKENLNRLVYTEVLITSGTLHRTEIFDRIGYFCDQFFIDCIDHDFCFRARKHGYLIAAHPDITMNHQLGYSSKEMVMGLSFYTYNYSPMRRYYMFRNSIWITKKYFTPANSAWFAHHWISLCKDVVKITLAEKNRGVKIKAIIQGLGDGLFNKPPQQD